MFDDVLRKMRQLERGVRVPIDLGLDGHGYLDRICPSPECRTSFKVLFEDWAAIIRDEEVFCPLCRHDAESSEWNAPEQAEYIERAATAYVAKQLGQSIKADARRFNRSQSRSGFVTMSMSYNPGRLSVPVPASAAELMTQEFACEECQCRFASIGAAFFCPACGHNSVLGTFSNSLATVRETIAALPAIRQAIKSSAGENVAEDSVRHICENGLVKIVASFQRFAEASFFRLPNAGAFKVRKNLFQSLSESDDIWRRATGTGYTDLLTERDYDGLSLYFQQRHVLSHLDGIVDEQYIARSNDQRFDVGQRLVVSEAGVSRLAAVIETLSLGLNSLL